jgi:hypothetical protein
MAVLNFDGRQRGAFTKSFKQYVSPRVGLGRINDGRATGLTRASIGTKRRAKARRFVFWLTIHFDALNIVTPAAPPAAVPLARVACCC